MTTDPKRTFEKVDLDSDIDASNARLEVLRRGRQEGDIPPTDEYWKALRKRRSAHGAKPYQPKELVNGN